MKRIFNILIFAFGMMALITSCGFPNVEQGKRGVLVKRPWVFGSSGVETLGEGRWLIAYTSDVLAIDVRPDRKKEEFTDLTSSDRTSVKFDIYFTIQPIADSVHILYTNFGFDYYEKNLEQEFRNLVRDKAKSYDMNSLCNDSKTSIEICSYIQEEGSKMIRKLGVPVKLIAVNMSAVNPPNEVISERNATAAARQREQTIVQNTKNEQQRQQTEKERAIADKMYQNEMSMPLNQYLEYLKIKNEGVAYAKASNITLIKGNVPSITLK